MAIATKATTAVDAIKERLTPALDTLDETVNQGRRVFARGQRAAKEAAADAAGKVRHNPWSAIVIAAGAGALVGGLVGVALASLARWRE